MTVDGRTVAAAHRQRDGEGAESFVEVDVAEVGEVVVRVVERG